MSGRQRQAGPGAIAAAYSAAGPAWQAGPTRVYDILAREQLAVAGIELAGAAVLDLGAGTGAASRAALAAGARCVTAVDLAAGMLLVDRERRPPAVVGDAMALPFAGGTFDVVVAAFSLNHVVDPAAALAEAARVARRGGWVLSSSYATDDDHPVKHVVDDVAARWGWRPARWHEWVRTEAIPLMATADRARGAAMAAGLTDISVTARSVGMAALGPADLVGWRLGMAQFAEFLGRLSAADRSAVHRQAVEALGEDPPLLERSVLFLAGRAGDGVSDRAPVTPAP